jgi:hypothetical protein
MKKRRIPSILKILIDLQLKWKTSQRNLKSKLFYDIYSYRLMINNNNEVTTQKYGKVQEK